MAQRQKHGFTLTELLVVIAIIALLITMVIPGINMVRRRAKESICRALLETIGQGVEQFRQDLGRYPASAVRYPAPEIVENLGDAHHVNAAQSGAHRLFEAMAGLDLLGYSNHMVEHNNTPLNYYYVDDQGQPCDDNGTPIERHGPYLDMTSVEFGRLQEVADQLGFSPSGDQKFVWEDNEHPVLFDGLNAGKPRPILYFRAHRNATQIHDIYDYDDNKEILGVAETVELEEIFGFRPWKAVDSSDYVLMDQAKTLPGFLWDPETGYVSGGDMTDKLNSPTARPYKSDTFILWSAGLDGKYGTDDDITNFTRRD